MQRPSSARTTQTKNYFDSRDAKNDESTEISPPFLQTNDEKITQRYLYRKGENGSAISSVDDVLFDVHEWNLTRTVKPKDQFVDDMKFCITGIRILDEYLIGQLTTGESGSLDNEPKTEVKSLFARISRYWWSFCCRITEFITTCFTCHNRFQMDGVNTSGESKRNADLMAGEDGIFVSPIHANPITKASHLSRVEARMRRELSLASNATKNDTTREGPNEQADVPDNNVNSDHFNESTETSCAEPDESYCLSPEDQRSTNRNCRHQQVEVTIQVDQVKFSSHPGFNAEEKALSQISDLYGKYQAQIESKPFHYFVTRLIAILRYYMRTIHAERSEEEKICHSVSSALVLNDDLKTTTRNLVKTLDSVQYLSSRIKEKWGALLSARESAGFACTDAALENINVPNAELANDVGRLTDEIASIRPKLTAIYNDVTNDSLSYLEEVERKISDASCLFEVLKLTRSKNSQLGWIPREEKLRRRKISSEKYFARLIVNGHSVGDTHAEQLDWPSFSIRLGHRFRCNLSEQPNDVCIQIWMLSTGFMPAKNISTCYISIPEKVIVAYHKAKLKSTTPILPVPTVEWYQFSSEKCFGECRGAALIAVRNCVRYENCLIPATRSAKMSRHSFTFVGHSKKLMRSSLDHRGFVKRQSAEKPNLSNSIQQKMNDNSSQNAHIFNCFIPILQYGMSFKLLSTSSFFYNKSLLEEPTRHALIKKRQTNANIPSPIPIDELLVQDSERHHSLIRNDAETTLGVSLCCQKIDLSVFLFVGIHTMVFTSLA